MTSHIWHDKPASHYLAGYPVGNGALGAMMLGTCPEERLALNHEWLWRAEGRFRDFKTCHQHLDEIRRLFFEGKVLEAGKLANEKLGGIGGVLGTPPNVDAYQPAGDLFIHTGHESVTKYRRELDFASAVTSVQYEAGGVEYRRECFAHAGRLAICVRLSASRKGTIDATFRLSRVQDPDCTLTCHADEDTLRMSGEFVEGSRFSVLARVYATGGKCTPEAKTATLRIAKADEVLVILSIAVAHDGEDPEALAEKQLADVPRDWDALLAEHKKRFATFYDRVSLTLGEGDDSRTTSKRLEALKRGESDNGLFVLYFNYGRYLLISSSLMGQLPANIMGIWNDQIDPPWQCDFHHDVNLQMNYWPAEVCNLPESTEALIRHTERFVEHGREMARKIYNCRGTYLPLQTDPWGRATPESQGWDVWTGAAAWLAQHMWWRYEWGGDVEFLRKRAYPFFKEVALFYEDYLVRDPQGRLVPVPSQSPENFFVGGTQPTSLCVGATMDLELIRDVLTNAIRSSEILEVDDDLRKKWLEILAELPPLQVGRHGQLQEWLEDYEEGEPSHRHISHLFALFPGDQLTLEEEPELTQAARVSLYRRLACGSGDVAWSCAWVVCCFARLREPDMAWRWLRLLIAQFATESLLSLIQLFPPPIFSIDGNLGGTAAIAEMLLQSHRGLLRLLPALPRQWPVGAVRGLVARGGFIVDIEWQGCRPARATITSQRGGKCRIGVLPGQGVPQVSSDGRKLSILEQKSGILAFDTQLGKRYELQWQPPKDSRI